MPTHITRDDLHHRMANGQRPVLVEALGAGFYADAHLPGADQHPPRPGRPPGRRRCCPTGRRRSSCTAPAPAPAATPSPDASKQLGYATVAVYRGGKEDWVEHGLPLERLDTDGE